MWISSHRSEGVVRVATRLACATLVFTTVTCGGSEAPTDPIKQLGPNATFIKLASDPGDPAGIGKSFEYDQTNSKIEVIFIGSRIQVIVRGEQQWIGTVAMATGTELRPGTYTKVSRFDDTAAGVAGLDWAYEGGACANQVTGSITIDSVRYSGLDVMALDLHFDQHCDGVTPALRGTIRWRADDTTKPPGPVVPVPTNLWKPSAASVPTSGNYVVLSSQAGDPIGLGRDTTLTGSVSAVMYGSTHVTVRADGYLGEFEAMLGTEPIAVGYYANVTKWFTGNPARPQIHFWTQGRGCGQTTGWYAIDKIVITGTSIIALDLRFEQHCDGATAALRGAVHWSN